MSSKDAVRLLIIESGSELEMAIPPNIALLVAVVKTAGFDVKVFSTNDYKYSDLTGDEARVNTLQVPPGSDENSFIQGKKTDIEHDFLALVKEYQPHIVGLSTPEPTYELGAKLLSAAKSEGILTIAGGVYASLCPEDLINEDFIDVVCVGEGEEALVELCQSVQKNYIDYEIKNLWFKTDTGVKKNPSRSLKNVSELPFQDWSPWVIPPRASKSMAGKIRTTALVELTRGCPFNCSFCANHNLNTRFNGNYRERSIDQFVGEVRHLKEKYNVEFIYIADETILTTSGSRFQEFIEKYGEIGLPFWCQTRPEFITENKIRKLKEVGLQAINIGIESGNFEFREKILNRKISDDQIISGIQQAIESGVRVGANAIIGFPGESRDHIFETIELVRRAKPTSTMVHLFQPYKGTPLRETSVKMGLIEANHMCGDYRLEAIGTGLLTAEELIGLQRTFNLYVDLSMDRWEEIRDAEQLTKNGDVAFSRLAREYQLKHFGRTSFAESSR